MNFVRQDRWTFAVGQGLFHYEEIKLPYQDSRPMTIVYDTGTFSKHSDENDAAYYNVEQVNKRLKFFCKNTIDYLVLSHFHADHYNLMSQLITKNKVRYFVAPLLTPENNTFEIAAVAYDWLLDNSNFSESTEEKELITKFVDKGTDGFSQQLFRDRKPNQFIYVTDESNENENTEPIVHFIPDESSDDNSYENGNRDNSNFGNENGDNRSIIINHNQPIIIKSHKLQLFWNMVFYCNTPNINPPRYWSAAKGLLKEQLKDVWEKYSDKPDLFRDHFEHIFSKKTYLPKISKKNKSKRPKRKKVTFDDVFGYADANMTSLTMYSGINPQQDKLLYGGNLFRIFPRSTGPRDELEHGIEKLLVHTAKETLNGKRQSLDETFESQVERLNILKSLYRRSQLCFIPHKSQRLNINWYWRYSNSNSELPIPSYKRPTGKRNLYWSWIGFGDMNFENEAVAKRFIEHFKKQDNLLETVGCCSAPHHGSYNGFATNKIPSEFPGAVCLISCDPNREGFGHPRIEAVSSILQGGMLPTLVSDQEQSTFHETLFWTTLDY